MRLYRGKVGVIAEEMTQSLMADGDIEVESDMVGEVRLDIEAVLNEYRRKDREILERAKDAIAERSLDYGHTQKVRMRMAGKEGFGVGDKAMEYITTQLLESLLHSKNVEEIFAEDHTLRRKMVQVLKKHTEMDDALDREVKSKIKNLQEGSSDWEVEYSRVMGDTRRNKGLT